MPKKITSKDSTVKLHKSGVQKKSGNKKVADQTPTSTAAVEKTAKSDNETSDVWEQLVVWPNTVLEPGDIEKMIEFFKKEIGVRIKFEGEEKTLPDKTGPGGRNDVFFWVHDDDVGKFTMPKLAIGARWWEDIWYNESQHLYLKSFWTTTLLRGKRRKQSIKNISDQKTRVTISCIIILVKSNVFCNLFKVS